MLFHPPLRVAAMLGACAAAALAAPHARAQAPGQFRPPATPLVTSDPYLCIWSDADTLNGDVTRHWTHHPNALDSLIRIDGKSFRLMGTEPLTVEAFPQVGLQVLPTRSIYDFDNGQVHVTLTFLSPALPHELDVLTRPLSYLTWSVRSVDGKSHAVSLFDSASSQLSVNTPDQKVAWSREKAGSLTALKVGTVAQTLFSPAGDDTRIDWGYAYLAAPTAQAQAAIGATDDLLSSFVQTGALPAGDDTRMPRAANDAEPAMAVAFDLGSVGAKPVERQAMVAYDEIYEVKFFGEKLRPYWSRNGMTAAQLLETSAREFSAINQRCVLFDGELMADLAKEGGPEYARMGALAYRQCLAGTGIAADRHKQPLLFTKENTSNGDIATMDVIFPMDPMLILLSPTLAKASIVPILAYGGSPRWRFPNAPHDLGTYPVARGTDDGGEQMPVEESGNVLLICDAIAREDGNANFVTPYWKKLSQWAQYLQQFGQDPEDQLCTDDFMGHLAHNTNLSVKAILALASYADLCRMRGETANAEKYQRLAKGFAKHWIQVANDGDHYRLAFDKPNTWSQKYNLVWDKILGLNIFPPSVAKTEVNFYKSVLQPYGLPLDSRTKLTKSDWTIWSATLADNRQDFLTLTAPLYAYLNSTSARVAFADSYETNVNTNAGMHARPVIGGIFIRMLADGPIWKKWSSGDPNKAKNWADLPPAPVEKVVVATSRLAGINWRYTTQNPGPGWNLPGTDVSAWKEGPAPFGTIGGSRTVWNDTPGDIWIRRDFVMPAGGNQNLQLNMFHDEDTEVYVNGVLAATEAGYNIGYEPFEISGPARKLLIPGAKVTLAAHVHQTTGGQAIDIGLSNVSEPAN
jgi:hypothetical protein